MTPNVSHDKAHTVYGRETSCWNYIRSP